MIFSTHTCRMSNIPSSSKIHFIQLKLRQCGCLFLPSSLAFKENYEGYNGGHVWWPGFNKLKQGWHQAQPDENQNSRSASLSLVSDSIVKPGDYYDSQETRIFRLAIAAFILLTTKVSLSVCRKHLHSHTGIPNLGITENPTTQWLFPAPPDSLL